MRVVSVEERVFGSELLRDYPTVINQVTNPSFEVDLAGWTSAGGTNARAVANPTHGTASLRVQSAASGQGMDYRQLVVENGKRYYVEVDVTVTSGNGSLRISDGTGTQKAFTSRGTTGKLALEFVADADATDWRIRLLTNGATTHDLYYDSVMISEISTTGQTVSYADGSMAGYSWAGTAHASATIDPTALRVVDPTDFEEEGGQLAIGSEVMTYEAADEVDTVTLSTALAGSYTAEQPVYVHPLTVERVAHLTESDTTLDGEDDMEARVPHALYDKLSVGLRDVGAGEGEAVLADYDGDEFVITDVLGQEPVVDGQYIEAGTVSPGAIVTDGLAPLTSPTPTVQGGVGYLAVKWDAISNSESVTYDVHVSTTTGFTPGPTTKAGETPGTLAFIRKMPDGSALVYESAPGVPQVYYVKIVARDIDGIGPASTQGVGSLDPAGTNDILAGAITAEKLETVMSLATSMVAGVATAQRVEIGYGTDGLGNIDTSFIGVRAFFPDGTTPSFRLDGATGDAYLFGRLDFGNSRLLKENIIELGAISTSGFQTPQLIQSTHLLSDSSVASIIYPSPTTKGNLVLLMLAYYDPDGTVPTPTTPANFNLELTQADANTDIAVRVYRYTGTSSLSGIQSITLGDSVKWALQMVEFSGVQTGAADKSASNTALASASVDSGTTAATTQADELWIAFGLSVTAAVVPDAPNWTNSFTALRNSINSAIDIGSPYGGGIVYYQARSAYKVVSATGTANTGYTLNSAANAWVAGILAYKVKPAGVDTPAPGKNRLYNKADRFGAPSLTTLDDTGAERTIRPFQDAERRIQHINDFLGANFGVSGGANGNIDGMFNAASNGTASQIAITDPEAGHPGVVTLDPGTTTTGSAYLNTRSPSIPVATGDIIRVTAILKTPSSLSNGTQRYAIAVGIFSGTDPMAVTTPGAWVIYSDVNPTLSGGGSLTAGSWGLLHGDGTDLAGDPLNDGSAPAVALSTWYRIDIEHVVGTGTSVWINGVKAVTSFSTNLFAGGTLNQLQVGVRKALGTTSRVMSVDLLAFEYIMATAR